MLSLIIPVLQKINGFIKRIPIWVYPLLMSIGVAYMVGTTMGSARVKAKYLEQIRQMEREIQQGKIEIERLNTQAIVKANQHAMELAAAVVQRTDEKEKQHETIDQNLKRLATKYTTPSVSGKSTKPTKGAGECRDSGKPHYTNYATARTPVLVKVPDIWGFSPQDRRLILEEAARADRAVVELNQCKAFLEDVYKQQEKYNKDVQLFQKQLNELNRR